MKQQNYVIANLKNQIYAVVEATESEVIQECKNLAEQYNKEFRYSQLTKRQTKILIKKLENPAPAITLSKSAAECTGISFPGFIQLIEQLTGERIKVKKNLLTKVEGVFIK
jgi:hypothetical protein